MKTNDGWRRHLRDLISAGLDPTVYAMQWAHDPRCLQRGTGHRRVGAFTHLDMSVCRLWAEKSPRPWERWD